MRDLNCKKILALVLVVMMLISAVPLNVFAADPHNHEQAGNSEDGMLDPLDSKPFEETLLLKQIKQDIANVLNTYLGSISMSEEDVQEVVSKMDEDTLYDAYFAIDDIVVATEELTYAEAYFLEQYEGVETLGYLGFALSNAIVFEDFALYAAGDVQNYFDGKVSFSDTAGTGTKKSETAYSATISATAGALNFLGSTATNTITVTNNAPVKATLKFTAAASNQESLSCGTGDKSVEIAANGTYTITLKVKASRGSTKTATLNLTKMSVELEQTEAVKYGGILSYDDTKGSVTVDGVTVANGSDLSMDAINGTKFVATAKTGIKFVAWVNADTNEVLSKDATYGHMAKGDMNIKAVFTNDACFTVGKTLCYNLTDAINVATNGSNKTIVLAADGTLPAGTYTIPSGVSLLIPYNAAETLKTNDPDATTASTAATAYRTLTMASGAKLIVNGALSVPAVVKTAQGTTPAGRAVGGYGYIVMEEDSNITVNGGMYVYGYISGKGTVTVNSGANVYETFQITDFRGGSATSSMRDPVFPMSQYYVQNVEVPMTVYSGATLNSYASVTMSLGTYDVSVPFFAKSNAMFNLTSGYVVKSYDGETDRLNIEIHGDMNVSPIKITIGSGILADTIDSKDLNLPITSNLTVKLCSGTIELKQHVAMLPGAKLIAEAGTMKLLDSAKVYVYDADEWGPYAGTYIYTQQIVKFVPITYAPGKNYTRTEDDLVDAEIYVKSGAVLDGSGGYAYTTKGGAYIHGDEGAKIILQVGTETSTTQAKYDGSNVYDSIPITGAQLTNADGTRIVGTTDTYTYTNGAWTTHVHTEEIIPGKAATCTETGLTEGKKCSDCGEILVPQQTIAKIGHSYNAVVTDPTCTVQGYTTYTCSCGDSYVGNYINATGHDYKTTVTAPTCTAQGYTTYTCSVCGDSYDADYVDAKGHTEVIDAAKAATCTETGLTEGKHCSVCDMVIVAQTVVPVIAHTEVTDAAKAPTCTETGLTEGKHCSVCGEVTVAQTLVPANGHKLDEHASCTDAGTCKVCGAELEAALGHEYSAVVTAPTCEAEGYTTHTCGRCGDSYTDSAVAALGHTEVTIAGKAPTCTATGLTDGKKCSVCGKVTVAQTVIAEYGHSYNAVVTDPTCTARGFTTYTCSVCGDSYVADYVDAKGHSYNAVVTDPTCTAQGFTTYTCSVCGDSYVADYVDAKGHDYNAVVTAPTCTEKGYTTYTCSCGDSYVSDEVATIKHTEVVIPAVEPTCQNYGATEGKMCSVCGTVTVQPASINKLAHVPGAEATCTEDQVCELCNTYVFVPALGHDLVSFPAKAPTRTESGYSAYQSCIECGFDTDKEVYPALGEAVINNYDDFIYNLALLEEFANIYVKQYPAKDPVALVIKYIRTGVERYNSGSWGIMAGYEDADFAKFVTKMENEINAEITDGNYLAVTGLKNLKNFKLPNGDKADIGHVFGSMDITYHNNFGLNHADVSGWAGDLVDLLEVASLEQINGTLDEMIATVTETCFLKQINKTGYPSFSKEDYDGDLDAFYIMNVLYSVDYGTGDGANEYSLAEIIQNYMTADLTAEYRAAYFMTNRLYTNGTREQVRNAVYAEYLSNKLISTLEGTRDLSGAKDLNALRRAVCYAFADYICKLAGDYVDTLDNPYYTVFSSESATLAPGVTQNIRYATSADGKQMAYYVVTADITRDDVNLYANYNNNDPAAGWEMSRVLDQANAAQDKYGNPDSEYYIPNYNVVASTNGAGFNMSTGEPGGVLVMNGVEYHAIDNHGFFGILKDGTPVIGTTEEYNTIYKDQVQEAIAGFGTTLIKNGEICVTQTTNYYSNRASRTAAGITATGKVVLMVLDGRQEPFSCGGSMIEIAQIMRDAGCVEAVNLDGGGSSTYVAKQPGDDKLSVVNKPSDGFQRSVSTSWMVVSTAPSSTEFDHALIESEYKYATIGAPVQMTAKGISPAGNETDMPEGYTWAVSDENWATISADGVFTGKRNGSVTVYAKLGDEIIGMTEMNVVVPENVYFTRTHMDAVYGANTILPVAASYENKPVAFQISDFKFSVDNTKAGTINGNVFVGNEASGVKVVKITACLANDEFVTGSITLNMFKQGENTFDFSLATGGDRNFAWLRDISNSTTVDNITYTATAADVDMATSYTFAIDMSQIPIPAQLADLTYMLPGADMENATAWKFMLQLAERVSVLTEIKAEIDFDDKFDVDISELYILNEYFELKSKVFDESTNKLTLTLNWIDQTKAIDPVTANALCMVRGVKLTPKADADWGAQNRLSIINTGTLSYEAYLRANALYSFAQKPENQEIYGLTPFINPDPQYNGESGAYFGDTYLDFEDSYTLVAYTVNDGWTVEDGGFAYYQNGEKLYGVNKIDGYYYDFGETGINNGQTKFTGKFFDEEAGAYRYSELGVLSAGWKEIDGVWHLFDEKSFNAVNGRYYNDSAIIYYFEDGRLLDGVWAKTKNGMRYWYGPSYYKSPKSWSSAWFEIDGINYCFDYKGYMMTGIQQVITSNTDTPKIYDFGDNGISVLYTGVYNGYFYENGVKVERYTLMEHNGNFYFVGDGRKVAVNQRIYLTAEYVEGYTYADGSPLKVGYYNFDAEGKMEVLEGVIDGYMYINNERINRYALIEFKDNFYFVGDYRKVAMNQTIYLTADYVAGYTFKDGTPLKPGYYTFDAEGKMVILEGVIDGFMYINNEKINRYALIEYNGDYYFVGDGRKVVMNQTLYLTADYLVGFTYEDGAPLNPGYYTFDAEGKMVLNAETVKNGVIDGYMYINNEKVNKYALIEYNGDYYFVGDGRKVVMNQKIYLTAEYLDGFTYEDGAPLKPGYYEFDAEGKMIIVEGVIDGFLYINNEKINRYALIEYKGDYYFVGDYRKVAVNQSIYLTAEYLVGYTYEDGTPFKPGYYEFDAEGKMVIRQGIIDGYMYINNERVNRYALIDYNGNYYFVGDYRKVAVNTTIYLTAEYLVGFTYEDGTPLKPGYYEFDAEGKMVIVEGVVDGYMYINNERINRYALIEYKGDFYFVGDYRKVAVDKTIYLTAEYVVGYTTAEGYMLEPGYYYFDTEGKLVY